MHRCHCAQIKFMLRHHMDSICQEALKAQRPFNTGSVRFVEVHRILLPAKSPLLSALAVEHDVPWALWIPILIQISEVNRGCNNRVLVLQGRAREIGQRREAILECSFLELPS